MCVCVYIFTNLQSLQIVTLRSAIWKVIVKWKVNEQRKSKWSIGAYPLSAWEVADEDDSAKSKVPKRIQARTQWRRWPAEVVVVEFATANRILIEMKDEMRAECRLVMVTENL